MTKPRNIQIVRYGSLKECLFAFLGRELTDDELKRHRWKGFNGGTAYNVNVFRWLTTTTRKAWGWANYRGRQVHIWCASDCTENELLKVLAHEIAHLRKPRPKDRREEEKKAALVERCCGVAHEIAKEILRGVSDAADMS